jgi:hypothetical protein
VAVDFASSRRRKFACGLSPASSARTLRAQPDGNVLVTDGGFWVLEAANLDEALAWGRKAAVDCRASVEAREILSRPDPKKGAGGRE